jgi:Phosphotransferase enzyme family
MDETPGSRAALAASGQWALARLRDLGLRPRQEPRLFHRRPWSTVARLVTDDGDFYLKVSAAALAHEAGLTGALVAIRRDLLPETVAIEPRRGWMLMRDGGPTLRSVLATDPDLRHWERILPVLAELQIAAAAHVPDLLGTGALDYRLSRLPALVDGLCASPALLVGERDGLTREEHRALRDGVAHFTALCAELSSYGPPETIHHDDFHDGNVFVARNGYRFFDWGEAGVAHPFCTMVVCLRAIAYRFGLDGDGPEVTRLLDVYLEPWAAVMDSSDTRTAFTLAQTVGTMCRALTWNRVLTGIPRDGWGEDAGAVSGWVRDYLEAEANA